MLIVTTPTIEGKPIKEYRDAIFVQTVSGFSWFKGLSAMFRDLTGGRSRSHEEAVEVARQEAMQELRQKVQSMGANAVVGLRMDTEMISGGNGGNGLLMVKIYGTAVVI